MTDPTTITIDNRTYRLVPVEPEPPAPKPQSDAEFWTELANGLPSGVATFMEPGSASCDEGGDAIRACLSGGVARWRTINEFRLLVVGGMASYVAGEPGAYVETLPGGNARYHIAWEPFGEGRFGPHAFSIALAACCKAIAERRAGKA